MYTTRKRYLKKKKNFLTHQKTFALFNASNLKTSKIQKLKLLVKSAKLYFIPLYLTPPKLAIGSPLIMVIYNDLKDLQTSILALSSQIDCVGVSIKNKWYNINYFNNGKTKNLTKKSLTLFLVKLKQL